MLRAQQSIEYLALAEKLSEDMATPRRPAVLREFEAQREQLEDALSYFLDNDDLDHALAMVLALRDCWWQGGRVDEGRVWIQRVLACARTLANREAQATTLDLAEALACAAGDFKTVCRLFQDVRDGKDDWLPYLTTN